MDIGALTTDQSRFVRWARILVVSCFVAAGLILVSSLVSSAANSHRQALTSIVHMR